MFRIQLAGEKVPINVHGNKEMEKYCGKILSLGDNTANPVEAIVFDLISSKYAIAFK